MMNPSESPSAQLERLLNELPAETDRGFELALTNLVSDTPQVVKELEDRLPTITDDRQGFAVFYALGIAYRRLKDSQKLDTLFAREGSRFQRHPMYNHLLSLSLRRRGSATALQEALLRAQAAAISIPDNAGVVHNFASCVAQALEEEVEIDEDHLPAALEAARSALNLDPDYAKYYCTYGRLRALRGDFVGARRFVARAVDIEDSAKSDYAIRIGDYQDHLLRITFRQYSEQLSQEVAEYRGRFDATQERLKSLVEKATTKNLEFLGFFAAIVSFTIASVHILSGQPFEKATQLILTLSGALLCAFAGFLFLLHGRRLWARALAVFVLGLMLVLLVPKLLALLS